MLWLWLDDQPSTAEDIYITLKQHKINFKTFQNPAALFNYLIEYRERKGNLDGLGLILDILLQGQRYISLPEQWTNLSETLNPKTEGIGHDGGLVFYEKAILNLSASVDDEPYWNPVPPVVFLTVIDENSSGIASRLQNIKEAWGASMKVDISEAKIKLIRKWDASEALVGTIRRFENE